MISCKTLDTAWVSVTPKLCKQSGLLICIVQSFLEEQFSLSLDWESSTGLINITFLESLALSKMLMEILV